MAPYRYRPLNASPKEIRVVRLHSGVCSEPIRLSISHVSFEPSETAEPSNIGTTVMKELQDSLPETWTVTQTLDGRAIFHCKPDGEDGYTSWEHPDQRPKPVTYVKAEAVEQSDPRPHFEAVSYTWGHLSNAVDVEVVDVESPTGHTSTIQVGSNLYEALVHLRHPESGRTLWIDALCINQGDLIERSQQVNEMRNIYKFASRVIIWLGQSAEDSTIALQAFEYIGKQLEYSKQGYFSPSPHRTERDWWDPDHRLTITSETWHAIVQLIQRPYFDRLWIMQELQLANRESIVQCGSAEILWYYLRRAFLKLYYETPESLHFTTLSLHAKMEHMQMLSVDLKTMRFEEVFHLASNCQCADPRDKIFGILGLLPTPLAQCIEPNYSSTMESVYTQSFLASIKATRRLSLLGSLKTIESQENMPSWVPDLNPPQPKRYDTYHGFASSFSAAHVSFKEPNLLYVSGVFHDKVKHVGPDLGDDVKAIYRSAEECISSAPDQHPFCNTAEGRGSFDWICALGELWDKWRHVRSLPSLEAAIRMSQQIPSYDGRGAPHPYAWWYKSIVINLRPGRLFVTEKGYIGFTRATVQSQDKVVILLGHERPILLRTVSHSNKTVKNQVVGESYIHGLMEGQAILGSIPTPWSVMLRLSDSLLNPQRRNETYFYNSDTMVRSRHDPRLEALPNEWEEIDVEDDVRLGTLIQHYRNKLTGEIINSDPRLLPEALEARGVLLEMFELI
jgi:hypothetical protein